MSILQKGEPIKHKQNDSKGNVLGSHSLRVIGPDDMTDGSAFSGGVLRLLRFRLEDARRFVVDPTVGAHSASTSTNTALGQSQFP